MDQFDQFGGDDGLGCRPSAATWESRRNQFRRLEANALGPHAWSAYGQAEPLLRELEHAFCAGAWIATIVVAQALVESSLAGFDKAGRKTPEFLLEYGLGERATSLRDRRHSLVHRTGSQEPAVSLEQQLSTREELRHEAKKAVAIALDISLLPSRHPEVGRVTNK